MQNFRIIPAKFSTMKILDQLKDHPELWGEHKIRTYGNSFHREVDDILFHFEFDKSGTFKFYDACEKIPAVYDLCGALLTAIEPDEGTRKSMVLGRIVMTKLPMQGVIYQHIDLKEHTDNWNRYHMCITGSDSTFYCGDEELHESPGLCFWFDNSKKHWVFNQGQSRIHLIVDVNK